MPSPLTERRFRARATLQHTAILPTEIPIPAEERNPVPEVEAAALRWYVCTTVPQGERRASDSLRRETDRLAAWGRAPFVPYVPCSTVWQERRRGALKLPRREVQTPLVRSYLFVGVCGGITGAHLGIMSERNSERLNRHGLSKVLGSAAGIPLSLGGTCLAAIVRYAQGEREAAKTRVVGESEHVVGDLVRITGGPMASFEATVMGVDPEAGRLLAEVEIFGRMTPIELDFEHAAKAA